MKKTIYTVIDCSGSMSEGGKLLIARGAARAVEQYFRLAYGLAEIKLIAWSNDARIVAWDTDQEYPHELLVSQGSSSSHALITLLGVKSVSNVLIITDGFWSQADSKALKRWKDSLPLDTIRVIKVGADSSPQLKGTDVFSAEDLFAALDGWLEGGVA